MHLNLRSRYPDLKEMQEHSPAIEFGREKLLVPPHIGAACRYLASMQIAAGCWPPHAGGDVSLYHTALATAALCGADRITYEAHIAGAAYQARLHSENNVAALNMLDVACLVTIAASEQISDRGWLDRLGEELSKRLLSELDRPERIRVRDFAFAVKASAYAGTAMKPTTARCIRVLHELQIPGKGGWTAGATRQHSVIASAYVLDALASVDPRGSAAVIHGCTNTSRR